MLSLAWVILFAFSSNSFALEDKKVHLSVPHTMNLIADFKLCEDSVEKGANKIAILGKISKEEKARADNLAEQNKACNDNFGMVEEQAKEWKDLHTKCSEELSNCNELPWWKIDFKSAGVGILLTLLLVL